MLCLHAQIYAVLLLIDFNLPDLLKGKYLSASATLLTSSENDLLETVLSSFMPLSLIKATDCL